MSRAASIVSFSLPPKLLREAEKLAKKESRNKSELLREALRQYIQRVQRWEQIQEYGIKQAQELGIKEEDVERLVDEVRSGK